MGATPMTMNRRELLKTVGVGALAVPFGAPLYAQAKPNGGPARLIPGCCAYSYNQVLKSGAMTLNDLILQAVAMRLLAVDITTYYLESTEPEYLRGLRHFAFKHAVVISGVSCRASTVQADAAKRADVVPEIKQWVDVADQLGASHLRIFAGVLPAGVRKQDAIDWTVEAMKAACEYSGRKGIMLGLEDHQGVTQTADVCVEIMQRVQSPYAGINVDITNFIATPAQDAYAQIAACMPYASGNIHIRDHFPDHSPVDMERVWQIFIHAGYQGYVSAEYEPSFSGGEPSATGVPKLVRRVQELCRKYPENV
jgi:sugar phosphate isomerase/epimerase